MPDIRIRFGIALTLALALSACASAVRSDGNPLRDRVIVVDPGHGGTAGTDSYRAGPAGEREEWIVPLKRRDVPIDFDAPGDTSRGAEQRL